MRYRGLPEEYGDIDRGHNYVGLQQVHECGTDRRWTNRVIQDNDSGSCALDLWKKSEMKIKRRAGDSKHGGRED